MAIYSSNNVFEHKEDTISKTQCYTILGQENYMENDLPRRNEEDDKVYAKQIMRKDNSKKYMIRLDASGKLMNPLSTTDEKSGGSVFLESVCRSNKKFKEVNTKAFEWYLKFLSTKNSSWLHNAEREVY